VAFLGKNKSRIKIGKRLEVSVRSRPRLRRNDDYCEGNDIKKTTPELFIAGLCALKSENAKSVGNTRDRRRRIVDRERLKCADTIGTVLFHSNAKIYIYFSNKIYESVPKIIINDTINLVFFKLQAEFW